MMEFLISSSSAIIWLSTQLDDFMRTYCHEPLEALHGDLWTQPMGFVMRKQHPLKGVVDDKILEYLKRGVIARAEHETQNPCNDHRKSAKHKGTFVDTTGTVGSKEIYPDK